MCNLDPSIHRLRLLIHHITFSLPLISHLTWIPLPLYMLNLSCDILVLESGEKYVGVLLRTLRFGE